MYCIINCGIKQNNFQECTGAVHVFFCSCCCYEEYQIANGKRINKIKKSFSIVTNIIEFGLKNNNSNEIFCLIKLFSFFFFILFFYFIYFFME